ncbi:hypothetical protein EDD11_008469 [Mortierella claussenii]|nr:hypothetical protein EDD11_008469 [Mortierella claussenii]
MAAALEGTEAALHDGDFELEKPNKKRFEPGFSFHFKSRNSSTGSIFSTLSSGFKPSHQRSYSHQQPQQQQQPSKKQPTHKQQPSYSGSASSASSSPSPQAQQASVTAVRPISRVNTTEKANLGLFSDGSMNVGTSSSGAGVKYSIAKSSTLTIPTELGTAGPAEVEAVGIEAEQCPPEAVLSQAHVPTEADTIVDTPVQTEVVAQVEADSDDGEAYGLLSVRESAQVSVSVSTANLLPSTVTISNLPEYFPADEFGRNSKRNEQYARLRLVALREHQQILVRLLGEVLGADNLYRQDLSVAVSEKHSHHSRRAATGQGVAEVKSHHPSIEPTRDTGHISATVADRTGASTAVAAVTNSLPCVCGCQARCVRRRQRRDAAVRGYQKAIVDLWLTDQNLCYWLSRYIRTTRRTCRSLNFMLTSVPTVSALMAASNNSSNSNYNDKDMENGSAAAATASLRDTPPLTAENDSCMLRQLGEYQCPDGGVSIPELERMGILQSKLLSYIETPPKHSYMAAWMSALLPSVEQPSILESSVLPLSLAPPSKDVIPLISHRGLCHQDFEHQQQRYGADFRVITEDIVASTSMSNLPLSFQATLNPVATVSTETEASDTDNTVTRTITVAETVSGSILPLLSPFAPAPLLPPPAIPAPLPPGASSTYSTAAIPPPPPPTPQSSTSLTHLEAMTSSSQRRDKDKGQRLLYKSGRLRSTTLHYLQSQDDDEEEEDEEEEGEEEEEEEGQKVRKQHTCRSPNFSDQIQATFWDYDDLEAAVFVGFHMQSLQKAKDFLHQFNKETVRSRLMLERFKVARDVYEHRVMGHPWRMKLHHRDLKRANRAS